MVTNEEMVERVRAIASRLHDELPRGLGFMVLLFDVGPDGSLAYASNAQRLDVVRAMIEFISRPENDEIMAMLDREHQAECHAAATPGGSPLAPRVGKAWYEALNEAIGKSPTVAQMLDEADADLTATVDMGPPDDKPAEPPSPHRKGDLPW